MRRKLQIATLALLLAGCDRGAGDPAFVSRWRTGPDRDWAGPEFWANRLQDWRVREGRLECVGGGPLRTVHLLTRRLGPGGGDFEARVRLGSLGTAVANSAAGGAGFLIGAGRGLDYRAAALIHHSSGALAGIYAGIDAGGSLFFRDLESDAGLLVQGEEALPSLGSVVLQLSARRASGGYELTLTGTAGDGSGAAVTLGPTVVDPSRLQGNVALACDARRDGGGGFWFQAWRVAGAKLEVHEDRKLGPVIGSQHTLSKGTLKLTAQLMPIGELDESRVELQLLNGRMWETAASAPVVVPGFTATFQIDGWETGRAVRYRLAYPLVAGGVAEVHYEEGLVRRDPVDEEEIVVAAFTGNHNVAHPGVDRGSFPWNWGLWFPHADIVGHVRAHDPDLLFFSGDQVYEGASPTRADFAQPLKDYLYKWYLWFWAFGELTAEIPSITIPDDHDVYHGNIWGAGGKATPPGLSGAAAQDAGGYKLQPEFVNMVQRTMASHLPEPFDPTPVEQGIEVYYTDLLYGGVSFAVIEDRKFKSAPAPLLPDAEVWNGWPQKPEFDPKIGADAPGAVLLGDRQLEFLESWASDWSGGAWMKVALSQTLFANLATLPDGATSGSVIPSLPILAPGEYADGEKFVSDMDSNGWPQAGRNRALRAMRQGFAVHLAGDQHLGSTVQYGVDEWRDAGFALCVPSIANFWPRRWFPPQPGANRDANAPRYTGDYEDGFGNKMTVMAVSNPHRWGVEPAALHERAPGYGIARFNRSTREISLAAWPRWSDPAAGEPPYPGWPVTFDQIDNYGREAVAYLPRLEITGMRDPVVQLVSEDDGKIVYTLRIRGDTFVPKVFALGRYTLHVGEPGTDRMQTFEHVAAASQPQGSIAVVF
jgi:alkaline phosphatase D